jgi:hypothetical protein
MERNNDGMHRTGHIGPSGYDEETGQRTRTHDPRNRIQHSVDEKGHFPSRPEIAHERERGEK